MKKRVLIVLLCGLLMMMTALSGCRALGKAVGKAIKGSQTSETESASYSSYDDEEESNDWNSEYGWDDEDMDDSDWDASEEDSDSDIYLIGNDDLGYLECPGDYVRFYDTAGIGEGTLGIAQAMSSNGDAIISLEAYDNPNSYTAEQYANIFYYSLTQDTEVDEESISGAKVYVGEYEAYQISCVFPEGSAESVVPGTLFYVIWVFETPDKNDYMHTIAIEFNYDEKDAYTYAETFHY